MFTDDQIDGATAEPASGHAGSEGSSLRSGDFDHHIELTATHFIVISQTPVRFGHQLTERSQIVFLEHLSGTFYASIFRHHMAAAAIDEFRKLSAVLFHTLIVRDRVLDRVAGPDDDLLALADRQVDVGQGVEIAVPFVHGLQFDHRPARLHRAAFCGCRHCRSPPLAIVDGRC